MLILTAMLIALSGNPVIAASANPAPAVTQAPLRVIVKLHASMLCATLRQNLGPAIGGLLVNDRLVAQGQAIMKAIPYYAMVEPVSIGWTGGAGAASDLADARMTYLVSELVHNLARIDGLLRDPKLFPEHPKNDDQRTVDRARSQLEAVAARQRVELNILSGTAYSNEANDLKWKVVTGATIKQQLGLTPLPVRMSFPDALAAEQFLTHRVEKVAARAVSPITTSCRSQ